MPWSNQSGGAVGFGVARTVGLGAATRRGPKPPDLEEFLRRSQDKLRSLLPGNLGGRGIALIALAAIALWGFSGFFRVEPDELGVVLRFGQFVREVQPGLNYHLPYPIETALTPQALRVNKIDIGFDMRRGTTMRDVPEESLMLTGDENIVDVDFSVLWKVKPNAVGDYLFNVQNPEGTVKAVAESAMREVIGRSNIQAILTGARQTIETAVQELMQKTLDDYGAGVVVQQVQLQKVDPPTAGHRRLPRRAGGALRSRARAERSADLRQSRRAGGARPRRQDHPGRRSLSRTDRRRSQGPGLALLADLRQYKKAPDVTRQRMYLETMERVLGGTDKTIIDTGQAAARRRAVSAAQQPAAGAPGAAAAIGRQSMKPSLVGGAIAVVLLLVAIVVATAPSSPCIRPGRRWWCGSANRCASSPSRDSTPKSRSSTA